MTKAAATSGWSNIAAATTTLAGPGDILANAVTAAKVAAGAIKAQHVDASVFRTGIAEVADRLTISPETGYTSGDQAYYDDDPAATATLKYRAYLDDDEIVIQKCSGSSQDTDSQSPTYLKWFATAWLTISAVRPTGITTSGIAYAETMWSLYVKELDINANYVTGKFQWSSTGTPTGGWCFYENFRHNNSANYYVRQVAYDFFSNRTWTRICKGTAGVWTAWAEIPLPFEGGYYQMNTWLQLNGAYGLYCPSVNGAHFYPNNASTYGSWRTQGSRNSYDGITLGSAATRASFMGHVSSADFGIYSETHGKWLIHSNGSSADSGFSFSAPAVWGAVGNDFADKLDLPHDSTAPGLCVATDGQRVFRVRHRNDKAVLGLVSNTFSFCAGENKGLPIAVAGYALAVVHGKLKTGDRLTNDARGRLVKAWPWERALAVYIGPAQPDEHGLWGGKPIRGRHVVRVCR